MMHEYTVVGHQRQKIIFFMAVISLFISHFITNYLNQLLKQFPSITITFSVSSMTIFGLFYLLFNHYIWKKSIFGRYFHFPNLDGQWECIGQSNNTELQKHFNWEGTIVIKQTWEKILISLQTKTSTSQSISVTSGIKYYPGVGYKVSYHYENTPNVSMDDLRKHEGFCVLNFDEDGLSANGFYFNNIKDRQSYGVMRLRRRLNVCQNTTTQRDLTA